MPDVRILLLAVLLGARVPAATVVVNDDADAAGADGRCTLREAISAANDNLASGTLPGECAAGSVAQQDAIVFDIPGPGPHTIVLQGPLPEIRSSLAIDGYTETGASENTLDGLTAGFDAVLMIRLTGITTASGFGALRLGTGADKVVIRGLEIFGLSSGGCCADTAITFAGSTRDIEISGNLLRDNRWRGIFMTASGPAHQDVRIGGPLPGQRNLIHGHAQGQGIALTDCIDCVVENNWLGVALQSGQPVAAGNQVGVRIAHASGCVVRDNWIAGNSAWGAEVFGSASGTSLEQNLIGGTIANGIGVVLRNTHGGPGPAGNLVTRNLITGNTGVGVAMLSNAAGTGVVGNLLRGNRIHANGGIGIDLGADGGPADGVNANDPGDLDAGPNGRQNHPVLGVPVLVGSQFSIGYSVDSSAAAYTLEFAFASECDPSGHGPGGLLLSDPVVLAGMPPAGTAAFGLAAVPSSGYVTALASAGDGTSEYSACQPYADIDALHADGFE